MVKTFFIAIAFFLPDVFIFIMPVGLFNDYTKVERVDKICLLGAGRTDREHKGDFSGHAVI
jgi:hypothetical protein